MFNCASHVGDNLGSATPPLYGPSSSSPTIHHVGLPFPTLRATSEPPPDMEDENKHSPSIPSHTRHLSRPLTLPTLSGDEYLWEWGGFPQKTPLNTTFGPQASSDPLNPGWDKDKATILPHAFDSPAGGNSGTNLDEEESGYGTGGRLRPDRNEPYRFILLIERKTTHFELALFPKDESGRKFGRNEVEDAQIFNERRIEYTAFLDDESIFQEGDLVIRWAGDREVYSPSFEEKSNGAPFPDTSPVPMDPPLWMLCQSGASRRSSTGTMGQSRVHHPLPQVQRVTTKSRYHLEMKVQRMFRRSKTRERLRCRG